MILFRSASPVGLTFLLFIGACVSTPEAARQDPPSPEAVAPTPVAVGQEAVAGVAGLAAVSHNTEGKEECLVCHGVGATPISDVPDTHEGRGNDSCMWCHAAESPMLTMTPTATPHARATAETDCMRCHAPGANERAGSVPETHGDRGSETCLWCHKKVEGR